MRPRKSFPPALLAELQTMPLPVALDLLGLYWKQYPDFQPLKDKAARRLYVSLGNGVVELLTTVDKGGAIDLATYLLRLDLVSAVKQLDLAKGNPDRS
ncbi:hypothetical protein LN565_15300 [Xanthomonas euvesicatoria pv. euvesicatoria]|uniref:hypothetical protein n=1 Tax=Xanthomonas TaxID=338 RepID=UPI0005733049|nr:MULTISPECIES: hypothetical protein [Xanthomonas]KHL51587.1 hypothetical protein XEU66b_23235 [Xanthomonas euvesicatoria]MCC8503573.1 hypothetical protein [Xanthomonas euvesicatoria pv. euvesicatoria]MCC8572204.1 hypothetical protein [Xanthomonas euvesicatoria pv. euvesicatoria]MCC8576415.1 hypothetical protein [Xanthomonas euvesicatoria pv. euvesicatoria]MCC8753936.1 hypothetical protein [Xanthomonas euvesicatoria pv. euvesicatoria]